MAIVHPSGVAFNHKSKVGFFDYNDSLVSQSVPGTGVWTKINNNGLGIYTKLDEVPLGMTILWNTTTNQFDFSELSIGDMVDIRISSAMTPGANNQTIDGRLNMAIGGSEYPLILGSITPKTQAFIPNFLLYASFYIGDDNTRLNPAEFQVRADSTNAVDFNLDGFYCKITKR